MTTTNNESSVKPKRKKAKRADSGPNRIELTYRLAELPSAQHRAGLAGLVLMLRWLERQPERRGMARVVSISGPGATFEFDRKGMHWLFDETYAAELEEDARDKPIKKTKGKNKGDVIPPLREEIRTVTDKKGALTEKRFFIYERPVPRGAFLADLDAPVGGKVGPWIKLWRDTVWSILRSKPQTRRPFNDRARGNPTSDSDDAWRDLTDTRATASVELPSTYFLGAQARTAENVRFRDRIRFQFLLHFWPYAVPMYVPAVLNNDGESDFAGVAFTFADVAHLEYFCEDYAESLKVRTPKLRGYRPAEAVVDLAIEGALDLHRRLSERLSVGARSQSTVDLVLGIEVVHAKDDGENVRILGTHRIVPYTAMTDAYATLRGTYWDPTFRRQRLLNLVNGRSWHAGFGSLLSVAPRSRTIDGKYFARDVREAFKQEVQEESMAETTGDKEPKTIEAIIYRLVGNYIARKTEGKTGYSWNEVKERQDLKAEYDLKREKVAKEAFLAVRSRTGSDFVDYFSSTLCSVAHHVGEDGYTALTESLLRDPEMLRTLTLLALSARG